MEALTLKQLRFAQALAAQGHFGRAAAACGVTQPALSMQIKGLEEILGAPLFERGPQGVRPTAFGETVLAQAAEVLSAVTALQDIARAQAGAGLTRLRLGIIPTIAPYLLPRLMAALAEARPLMALEVRETLTPTLVAELEQGRIDVAMLALPLSVPGLTELPLAEEPFLLVRPLAEANAPVPDAEGLQRMRLLLLEEGHCFRDQALAFCKIPSARPREGLEGSSLTTLVQMVGAGLGVTLIPQMAVGVETRSASVAVSAFGAPQPARQLGLVWRARSALDAEFRDLAPLIRCCLSSVGSALA